MRPAQSIEQAVGMRYYVSDGDGIGGRLRASPEDFVVRELEAFEAEPADADSGAYAHLVVRATLHNWDTNDFASALSDRLGISRERVSWAGTKDKRAVTTQLFSIADADAADVPEIDGAEIDVVGRAGRPVLFGDLAGNAFEITVRDVDRPEGVDAITEQLREFAGSADGDEPTVAVPNYFGQQRFGSKRPITHEVGLAIVRNDWEGAVMAYLGNPNEREPEATQAARAYVQETHDWEGALERFPRALGYERALCHSLADADDASPAAFRSALETLPTNLQTLFVNAAQSSLFNRILSERLDRGLPFDRPVAGDVVCFADGDAPADLPLPDTDRTQRVTAERVDTVERHCERGRAFVTAPLLGTETELAEGEPGEIERAVLADAGLEPTDFALPGEFDSSGTRRAVQVRSQIDVQRREEDAIRFAFSLPKGSYATVLLREYLKRDPAQL
ncbi:tRNA pseudouridine(13) synthase TruD [Halomicrobium mukohataei]|uniref:Probable tRNA pseudouridine synthase D n=1 Tax=Halomicrobium mukohataei TaxID=57705 RepID=A0A847UGC6_9EURY|nr:tRNA pseudouridine(13) synthase TruD [Halomicrobium mukohataei]NLV11536.1 tRNA pseudouridine(13) synthase TruD [Halomicrobium mukohataei]